MSSILITAQLIILFTAALQPLNQYTGMWYSETVCVYVRVCVQTALEPERKNQWDFFLVFYAVSY